MSQSREFFLRISRLISFVFVVNTDIIPFVCIMCVGGVHYEVAHES